MFPNPFAMLFTRFRPHQPRRSAQRRRLSLECLEDRTVPTLTSPVTYPLGAVPEDVIVADFTNDGSQDLAVISDGIDVLVGNGDGTFQSPVHTSGVTGYRLAAADFNGDGELDLSVAGPQTARVLLGNGDGTFTDLGSVFTEYGVQQVAIDDLNSDGSADLVISWNSEGYVSDDGMSAIYPAYLAVLLGTGDGTFAPPVSYYVTENGGGVATGDFDEDGHVDVLTWDFIFFGNGDGTLQTAQPGTATGFVADFNNDGHLDVLPEYGTDLCLGNGDGTFQNTPIHYGRNKVAADVDDDGNLDLVAGVTHRVVVVRGLGNGTFGPGLYHDAGVHDVWHVAAGDFNGDGYDDVAATLNHNSVRVFLNDQEDWDAPLPTVSVGDASILEGNTGSQTCTFTVTLTSASTQTITVWYASANSTATAPSDYVATSGTLTFAPGETSKTINVAVKGDRLGESDETFFVNLSGALNATIADGQALGTILDNEPRLSISDVTKAEGKTGNTAFIFTVTLSMAYDQAVTVSYQTENGTAQAGSDYAATSGTLTFSPGQTTKTITVNVKGDKTVEGNETFYLRLFGASTNALILDELGLGLILNDD